MISRTIPAAASVFNTPDAPTYQRTSDNHHSPTSIVTMPQAATSNQRRTE